MNGQPHLAAFAASIGLRFRCIVTNAAAITALAILLFGAAFHVHWAMGGRVGFGVSLPQHSDGEPVYSGLMHLWRPAALGVAVVLVGIALLVLIHLHWIALDIDRRWTGVLLLVSGLMLIARAVLPNRYVGLFKSLRTTRWARYDSMLYSPLILLLGIALLYLAV